MKVLKEHLMLMMVLLVGFVGFAQAQYSRVTGTVTDDKGTPLPGVSVVIKGTTKGVATDFDGKYTLTEVARGAVLEFSSVGYKTLVLKVTGEQLNVKLSEVAQDLDEVVVVGYGTQKRGDVTTAITSVKTQDLDQRPVISAAQAIQGRAAGIQVVQPNGAPGAGLAVRIRGNTSISASNDPLYVVDGIPVQDISGIAPTDIESMQVLKDASSAAIYGSRAANGVVLITTKQGKRNEPKVSVNTYVGISQVAKRIESLNTAQYNELMKETGAVTLPSGLTDKTDWFDETFRKSIIRNTQLSFSNATENTKYYISAGNSKDEGVIRSSFFERYNVRLNLETKMRKWLTFETNLSYADYSSNGIITGTGSNRAGVVLSVINTPKYAPIWSDKPGEEGWYYYNFYGANLTHPVENISRNADNTSKSNRLVGSVSAIVTFLPSLKFKSTVGIDRLGRTQTHWTDPKLTEYGRKIFGTADDIRTNNTVMTYDNLLTFDKSFGKHNLSALAGTSGTVSKWNESYLYASHFLTPDIKTLNAANKIEQGSGSRAAEWAIMSYLGRISYNYDSKYLLTANFRADGSSKLAPGKRWGYFPSVALAWNVSNENFLKDNKTLNELKLRFGYGEVGNVNGLGDYLFLTNYTRSQDGASYQLGDSFYQTYRPGVTNKNLRWEVGNTLNAGIDFGLLDNLITGTLDVYRKQTKDLIAETTIDPFTNFKNRVNANVGDMENKGIELGLTVTPIRNIEKNIRWSVNYNIAYNENKITRMPDDQPTGGIAGGTGNRVQLHREGETPYAFYVYQQVYDAQGKPIENAFVDRNGNGKIDEGDRYLYKSPFAPVTMGFGTDLNYKNWDLNITTRANIGNYVYNNTQSRLDQFGEITANSGFLRNIKANSNFQRHNDQSWLSDYYLENASFFKLDNITLGYTFPHTDKMYIRLYGTVQNVLTITKYSGLDPEVYGGIDNNFYPRPQTYLLGLNVNF